MPSFLVSSLLQCSRYVERAGAGGEWSDLDQDSQDPSADELGPSDSLGELEKASPFDYNRVERTISELSKEEEETVKLVDATFDCEIVRSYRQMHADNPNLDRVSNRDLVLMLGAEFEKMDGDVLEQVRAKDPDFHRFYLSLKALENSPLH